MILKYKNYINQIFESNQYNDRLFCGGDRVIITKMKSRFYNQTGIITYYSEYEELSGF